MRQIAEIHHRRQASKLLDGSHNLGGERVAPRFHPLPGCRASKGFLGTANARLPSQQVGALMEERETLSWREVRAADRDNRRIAPKRKSPEDLSLDAPDLKDEDALFLDSLPPAAKRVIEIAYCPLFVC